MIEITRDVAIKVRDAVDAGLSTGLGAPVLGQMCVEAAVCYALGLPHGDNPLCVSPALRRLKISLNDKDWSSNSARAKGLKRLALAQLGSAGVLDDKELVRRVGEMTIRKMVPIALRAAASIQKDATHRQKLLNAANRCEVEGTRAAVYAAAVYTAAGLDVLRAVGADAADYVDAAYHAASAASHSNAAKRDAVLSDFAEAVVQILIDMDAPGCQWLDLAPVAEAA
jgi:hypothetical protein